MSKEHMVAGGGLLVEVADLESGKSFQTET